MMIKQLNVSHVLSSKEQNGILAICALNKLEKKRKIDKNIKIGRLTIRFNWRSSKCLWGRFGGGWQWAAGFEASKRTLLLNCLVFSLMISRRQQ